MTGGVSLPLSYINNFIHYILYIIYNIISTRVGEGKVAERDDGRRQLAGRREHERQPLLRLHRLRAFLLYYIILYYIILVSLPVHTALYNIYYNLYCEISELAGRRVLRLPGCGLVQDLFVLYCIVLYHIILYHIII